MSHLRTGIIVVLAVSFGGLTLADRMWGTPEGHAMERRLDALERERDALAEHTRTLEAEQTRMRDDERLLAWHETRSTPAASDRGGAAAPIEPSSAGPQHDRSGDHANGNDAISSPPPSPTTEQLQAGLEQVFEDRVARALAKLGVYTQDDVARLAERVDRLSDAVNALIKARGGKPPAARTAAKPRKARKAGKARKAPRARKA